MDTTDYDYSILKSVIRGATRKLENDEIAGITLVAGKVARFEPLWPPETRDWSLTLTVINGEEFIFQVDIEAPAGARFSGALSNRLASITADSVKAVIDG